MDLVLIVLGVIFLFHFCSIFKRLIILVIIILITLSYSYQLKKDQYKDPSKNFIKDEISQVSKYI